MALNVGIEVRTSGHEQADTRDPDIGDAQALAAVVHFPLELDRLAAGEVKAAVDGPHAVGPGDRLADGDGGSWIIAEPLTVGARLRRFDRRRKRTRCCSLASSQCVPS